MGPRDWRRAQLIYKILSAIKVPLAEEPCRLAVAVKQVLRIGRGRQKCRCLLLPARPSLIYAQSAPLLSRADI